jgi:hypothetical protein
MRVVAVVVAVLVVLTVVYYGFFRPWMLSWGAKAAERRRALPGDDFVVTPRSTSTRAITIRAPVDLVWPWVAQMGQGRGGLYSYDRLENFFGADVHSVDRVIAELQDVSVGDTIRLVREGYPVNLSFEFKVAFVHPPKVLVLHSPGTREECFAAGLPFTTWAFVAERVDHHTTRLISRWRTDFKPSISGYFWWQLGPMDIVEFVMERKMLKGIRKRAEHEVVRAGLRMGSQSDAHSR